MKRHHNFASVSMSELTVGEMYNIEQTFKNYHVNIEETYSMGDGLCLSKSNLASEFLIDGKIKLIVNSEDRYSFVLITKDNHAIFKKN